MKWVCCVLMLQTGETYSIHVGTLNSQNTYYCLGSLLVKAHEGSRFDCHRKFTQVLAAHDHSVDQPRRVCTNGGPWRQQCVLPMHAAH